MDYCNCCTCLHPLHLLIYAQTEYDTLSNALKSSIFPGGRIEKSERKYIKLLQVHDLDTGQFKYDAKHRSLWQMIQFLYSGGPKPIG